MGIQHPNQHFMFWMQSAFLIWLDSCQNCLSTSSSDPSNIRRLCIIPNTNQLGMCFKSVAIICSIACIFATRGVDVIVATDGKTWPSMKRASFKRGAEREHAQIQCMMAKSELVHILQGNNQPSKEKFKNGALYKMERECSRECA